MTLAKLRAARRRSQPQVAEKLSIKHAAVSRLGRRTNMYLSTLRELIALISAMGGTLQIMQNTFLTSATGPGDLRCPPTNHVRIVIT